MAEQTETVKKRHKAWKLALTKGTFTRHDLCTASGASMQTVSSFADDWVRSGAIVKLGKGYKGRRQFRVVEGHAVVPQRTRRDGSAIPKGTPTGNMWRTMRNLKLFSAVDIELNSRTEDVYVDEKAARAYCQMLAIGNYLKVVQKAVPGRQPAIYRLIKNHGPRAPVERRIRAIWDDNVSEYTHVAGGLT